MIKEKLRKVTAFLLFVTTLLTAGFAGWRVFAGPDTHSDPQGAEQVFRMAEGFGTGADFLENNWRIETVFAVGTSQDITSDPNKYARIKLNEHSDNGEKIIRLINGIRATDLERADVDYRAGIAFFKNKISMEDTSEFSAKFTVFMPDACVNEVQIGDEVYAREAGGNGMAFVMTSSDSFAASVNSGMGYEGIPDSLIIEMDSYFNGAYCNFNMSSSGYVNWAYDNQIYANTALGYLQAVADDTRNKGIEYSWATNGPGYWTYLNNNGYAALAASRNRRFDHVGVMLNGNSREHIGISYLNGRYPDFVASGKYVNINNIEVNTPSSSRDCVTRFADEGDIASVGEDVDNRLFTFWLEYDGSRLCVRYANGSFDKAVRPADAQITVEGRSDLDRIFANDEVQIGFISSIGTSKAQHTIHSVAFANKYYKDGIKTGYTEKYYIESPDSADDFITVNGKNMF